MSYRGPDRRRMRLQVSEYNFKYAGFTAVWRQFISATTGVPEMGLDGSAYYREQTITAFFGVRPNIPVSQEMQTPGGQIFAGEFQAVTRERIEERDELVWRGDTYRIEGDPVAMHNGSMWATIVKRGN